MTLPTYYEYAADSWASSRRIIIRTTNETPVAIFPIEFIANGGDNTWAFVLQAVRNVVCCGEDDISLVDSAGIHVHAGSTPVAGEFWLQSICEFIFYNFEATPTSS